MVHRNNNSYELLELYYVKEGALTLLINGETYCLFAGDIAIVNSCHPQKSIHFSDHTVHYCLQIDLSALNLYSEGKDVHHVGHVLTYIATHYDTKLTLRDLATTNDISISHLCRIFKKRAATTIINYINQLRCDRARHLLSSGYSVTEAAMAVGFSDSNYFSRVFKKTFVISPSSG